MRENLVSDRSPFSSLLQIFLLLIFGFVILGPTIGVVAATLLYGVGFIDALADPLQHPEYSGGIILSQGVGAAIGLLFLPWFYLRVLEKRPVTIFFKNDAHWPIVIASVFIVTLAFSVAISPIIEWNATVDFPEWMSGFGAWAKQTEELAANFIKSITSNLSPVGFFFTFIVVAVIPAIGEELMFRGLIQNEFRRAINNPHAAIWISSIIFSAFHMQFMGFVPRVLLGAVLGYLYYWSGNLWVPVLAHFFNNGVQLIGLYLYQKGIITFDIESTDSAPWPVVAGAAMLTIFLLFFIKNYFSKQISITDDSAS
jgi:membrane protease YdiL (CAAX protease family)